MEGGKCGNKYTGILEAQWAWGQMVVTVVPSKLEEGVTWHCQVMLTLQKCVGKTEPREITIFIHTLFREVVFSVVQFNAFNSKSRSTTPHFCSTFALEKPYLYEGFQKSLGRTFTVLSHPPVSSADVPCQTLSQTKEMHETARNCLLPCAVNCDFGFLTSLPIFPSCIVHSPSTLLYFPAIHLLLVPRSCLPFQ